MNRLASLRVQVGQVRVKRGPGKVLLVAFGTAAITLVIVGFDLKNRTGYVDRSASGPSSLTHMSPSTEHRERPIVNRPALHGARDVDRVAARDRQRGGEWERGSGSDANGGSGGYERYGSGAGPSWSYDGSAWRPSSGGSGGSNPYPSYGSAGSGWSDGSGFSGGSSEHAGYGSGWGSAGGYYGSDDPSTQAP